MTVERHLDWDGCFNVRDLGGLPAADGHLIRRGAIVRADSASRFTASVWSALESYGVRTVVDLRHPTEREPDAAPRPAHLTTVSVALEDETDPAFWQEWGHAYHTPLYYRWFLERYPERIAAVVAAIAETDPGGVLVHCVAGRDRTGLVTLVLLALVGVPSEVIAADYALSADRLRGRAALLGRVDEDISAQEQLRRANTSTHAAIESTLAAFDAEAYLRDAGLSAAQIETVRARLLGEPNSRSSVLP